MFAEHALIKNAIKQNNNTENKAGLMRELRVHKVRANTFYKLLEEDPDKSITFCFDLQQIHPLPKSPIQDAFYLRQIRFYSCCSAAVSSRSPVFYTWSEDQAGRGTTEIGSALIAHLVSLFLTDKNFVRLFCDSCLGRTKMCISFIS